MKKKRKLPMSMESVRGFVDPSNDKKYWIFGSEFNNKCWEFNYKDKKYIKLKKDIPKHEKQQKVRAHGCAYFEIPNVTNENEMCQYALIYGGYDAYYGIYEMQNKKWNTIARQLNGKGFGNEEIMKGGESEYRFGAHVSMITDIFEKNKIHIIGGYQSENKYGCFKFEEQKLMNPNLSYITSFWILDFTFNFIWMCLCVCVTKSQVWVCIWCLQK